MNIKKQTVLMYLYEAALAFRMVDAVWVIFLLERGFSLAQVGIAEGAYHITSMIFEVPSGMAADLFGRKRTLILSGAVGICGAVLMTLDGWRGFVYCGMIFSALSLNLASGTEEALVYDSLLETGEEKRYKKIWANISLIARTASALACAASPLAILIGYRYTYYIMAGLYLCTILALSGVKEPIVTKRQALWRQNLKTELGARWKQHIKGTGIFIKENPKTMLKLLVNAALACPCYLIMMYLQEHLVNCGWPKSFIGIPMLVIPLAGALGTRVAAKNESKLSRALLACGVISGIGTCLVGNNVLFIVLLGACIARGCEGFSEIKTSENVNREFSSDYRATLVSVDSMLYSILMVAASPITGYLGERYSVNAVFYLLGGVLLLATIIVGVAVLWYYGRRNSADESRAAGVGGSYRYAAAGRGAVHAAGYEGGAENGGGPVRKAGVRTGREAQNKNTSE